MNVNAITCAVIGLQMILSTKAPATESLPSFNPKKIISGYNHTCLLSTSGHVKCWGDNNYGALGVGSMTHVGELHDTMGPNLPMIDLGKNVLVDDMCSGKNFSCALATNGRVKCWGLNYVGQLGQEVDDRSVGSLSYRMGDNLPWTNLGSDFTASSVQCGYESACAVNTKGQVKCWGQNSSAALGRQIPGRSNIGKNVGDMGDKLPYLPLPPVTSVSIGYYHGCAASTEAVYCWGNNERGQVGIESSATFVELPKNPKDAVKVKLEDDGVATTIHALNSGGSHVCAEYSTGHPTKRKIKCWGFNGSGQLGIGSAEEARGKTAGTMGSKLPELQLDSSNFIQRENYGAFSCALKRNGAVQCWGANYNGQLGLGDTIDRGKKPQELGDKLQTLNLGLPALALSHGADANSPCALLINHEVKCWGDGDAGQLGYEDDVSRGSKPGDMGENLPFVLYR